MLKSSVLLTKGKNWTGNVLSHPVIESSQCPGINWTRRKMKLSEEQVSICKKHMISNPHKTPEVNLVWASHSSPQMKTQGYTQWHRGKKKLLQGHKNLGENGIMSWQARDNVSFGRASCKWEEEKRRHTQRSKKGSRRSGSLDSRDLVTKGRDKWPEAIKLKQTVLPTLADRKRKDRQRATPGEARKWRSRKWRNTHKHTWACISVP